MKMKHNKKRNTAFLYESLIKELTKAIVKKDENSKNSLLETIKKYFSKGTILYEELKLYNAILNSSELDKNYSIRLIHEIKQDYLSIDRKTVFNNQTKLISEINKNLDSSIFSNFVPNYKNIATVGQFFMSSGYDAKRRLLIEQRTVDLITTKKKEIKNLKHVDNLTYNTFIKKFNESYDKTLRKEQKDLLTNYITSFSDNGLGLKSFLNEEIGRLKEQVSLCLETTKVKNNKSYLDNTKEILSKLDGYKTTPITEEIVREVFYIQDLVQEVLNNGD